MTKNSIPPMRNVEPPSRGESIVIPDYIQDVLGHAPVISTEDVSLYRDFLTLFAVEFDPQTPSEWFLVNDLVNANWEILRYRRAKTTLIRLACPDRASELIENSVFHRDGFSHGQFRSQPTAVGRSQVAEKRLAEYGLTAEDVVDSAMIENLDKVERYDTMIERLEDRREKLFREFHAHRSLNPQTAKQKANAIVDQFAESVEPEESSRSSSLAT
ncbi:hypothetical protein [Mesorhizobium xinjiangense]|uniref:hypothetical protein n=1 Tax=Mesorhizobium xinjiangense TaxID=2678685 RepID=UPI0012EE6977|nr:hypothetical protein [Mesorhizobium xinjiangense]